MKRLAVLSCFALLIAGCVASNDLRAQTTTSALAGDQGSNYERPIVESKQQIAKWERQADIQIAFVIAVIVFGALVSVLQGVKKDWTKPIVLVLGVTTSILTGINSKVFSSDYRALQKAALEARGVVTYLEGIVAELKDQPLTDPNRAGTLGEYFKKLTELQDIGHTLNENTTAGAKSGTKSSKLLSFPTVYAQTRAPVPAWVDTLPSDDNSLYFLGRSQNASLDEAKINSLNDALNNAFLKLRPLAPNTSVDDLLALIKGSAVVQNSAFTYDNGNKIYAYYTLLRLSKEIERLGIKSLPLANKVQSPPTVFKGKGWRPADLTSDPTSGMFVLDTGGGVSKLVNQKGAKIETLFRLANSYTGSSITASADSLFVSSNSKIGCTVFKYALATKGPPQRLLVANQHCAGIATDGNAIYVSMPDQKEIRYWSRWGASLSQSWSLDDNDAPGSLAFDNIGHRLIVAGASGKAYMISPPDGAKQLLNSNLGAVASIAASRLHILLASGKKVLFLSRSDGRGENPPASLFLTGGRIVGVTVDETDQLWFADYDNQLVEGPFALN